MMTIVSLCIACLPAGNPAPSLDDNRGICRGCGKRDGNLAEAELDQFLTDRGWWATNTGALRGPATL